MSETEPQWKFSLYEGGQKTGEVFSLTDDGLTIGRELDNDISIDDTHVSRHHAEIKSVGDKVVFKDLGTLNGTLINERAVTEKVMKPNDLIQLGQFTLKVEGPAEEILQSETSTAVYPTKSTPPAKQSRIETVAYKRSSQPFGESWVIIGGTIIAILILLGVLGWILFFAEGDTSPEVTENGSLAQHDVPIIKVVQGPADGDEVPTHQPVVIQIVASGAEIITRIELWENDRKVDEMKNPVTPGTASMTVLFRWTPQEPGSYELMAQAYDQDGQEGDIEIATLTVVERDVTPTSLVNQSPTPTITPLPLPATATPVPTVTSVPINVTPTPTSTPPFASLTVSTELLNVRAGPGTEYELIGQLPEGEEVPIVGQANVGMGLWWQIRFDPASDDRGWVSASSRFVKAANTDSVPQVEVPLPSETTTAFADSSPTPTPVPTSLVPTSTVAVTVIRPPDGKTLLIVSNRSLAQYPALLTLSGGRSVGGGQEIKVAPGEEEQLVLEPDFYRALWSSPTRSGGFTRGADFTAVPGKVVVMWIVPEDGVTETEEYDQLRMNAPSPPEAEESTPESPKPLTGYIAAQGRALLVAENRSRANAPALLTLTGGNYGGGQQIILDANSETQLELVPGTYRAIWTTGARPNFSAGRDFSVIAGEVILSWIIPEEGQVFMQFPGREAIQINN